MNKEIIFQIMLFCLFCFLSGVLFMLLISQSNIILTMGNRITGEITKKVISEGGISENCENLDLFETSKCLNENVRSFYKYNINNTGKELTLEQLKESGGVCSHFSKLYYNAGKELGFYTREVKIDVDINDNLEIMHVFTIISGKEGYCLLDNASVDCFYYLKNDSGE